MASFPENEYSPRDIENEPGVVYDANNKRTFFAEDLNATNAEIVAIENALRPNPTKPLPYGLKIGNETSSLTIEEYAVSGLAFPYLKSEMVGSPFGEGTVFKDNLVILVGESGEGGMHFFADDPSAGIDLNFSVPGKIFYMQGNLMVRRDDVEAFLQIYGRDPISGNSSGFTLRTNSADNRAELTGNLKVLGILETQNSVKSGNVVEAINGFKNNGSLGTTQNVVVVVNVRMNGTALEKKTRTVTISGGIVTAVSDISDWQST